jgi:hypothetical protein
MRILPAVQVTDVQGRVRVAPRTQVNECKGDLAPTTRTPASPVAIDLSLHLFLGLAFDEDSYGGEPEQQSK